MTRRQLSGRILFSLLWLGVVATALVACGAATAIPSGAQQVHIVVTDSDVTIDPATVHAGDVYLVLDAPAEGSFMFVEQSQAGATPGPLSDEDLQRLAEGDSEGTSIGGLDAGGCSPEQNAEARGKMGYCGNVMKVVLVEGQYAILSDAPEVSSASMAVLEVLP